MTCKAPPPKDWYEAQQRDLVGDCPECCGDFIAVYPLSNHPNFKSLEDRGTTPQSAYQRIKKRIELDKNKVCKDPETSNGWWDYFESIGGFNKDKVQIWHESEVCCTRLL